MDDLDDFDDDFDDDLDRDHTESKELHRLRKAIVASPDDDTPRLAFADAFEATDPEYAAFIRASCAWADLRRSKEERDEAKVRTMALHEAHGERWRLEISGCDSSFSRGFIETVRCSLFSLGPYSKLKFQPLRSLYLWLDDYDKECGSEYLHPYRAVTSLHLETEHSRSPRFDLLSDPLALPALKRLDISDPEECETLVATLDWSLDRQLERFAIVGFQQTDFNDTRAAELVRKPMLRCVRELLLWNCNLRAPGAAAIAESEHLGGLRRLALGLGQPTANLIGPDGARALAEGRSLHALESIELRNNNIGDEGFSAMLGSAVLQALTSLDVLGNGLTDRSVEVLLRSRVWSQLRALDLSHNQISPNAVRALFEAKDFALRSFSALLYGETGVAVRAIANSPHSASLRHLKVMGAVDVEGAEALCASPHLDALESLQVGSGYEREPMAKLVARFGNRVWQPSSSNNWGLGPYYRLPGT